MSLHKLRIGIGHDTHRLQPGGPLRLGGIEIPFQQELVGHSDADVLLHAITDAVLGAAGLGDIGEMFPNTDPANRDRDSVEMLTLAARQVAEAGYEIINLDCIVFAQQPRLSPFKDRIRQRIGKTLAVDPARVGLKGKTGEHVGPVGEGRSMEAHCVALLIQS
jgi:2-C-methyl-D-erythritol 2,4-cyclodiphosphate synthase